MTLLEQHPDVVQQPRSSGETARRRDWVCGLCGAGFDEKDEWADHLYEAHGETDDEVYDDPGDQGGDQMTGQLRIISLGWGVQSWTLAAMAALGEIPPVDFAVHADTTWEASGTYEHADTWGPWLATHGVEVVTVQGKRTDVVREDWSGSVLIPAFTNAPNGHRGQVRRQCTHDWKIMPIREFIRSKMRSRGIKRRPGVVESLLGISLDEYQRMRDSDVAYIANRYPLVDLRMTRADCAGWLERHSLPIPPKSSCVFCPYSSTPSWKARKRAGGVDWATALGVDAAIRNKRPPQGLFVHPHRKPLEDAVLIPEDEGATQLELPCDSGVCFV